MNELIEKAKALGIEMDYENASKAGLLAAIAKAEEKPETAEETLKDPAFNTTASCGCDGDLVCAVHSEKKIEDLVTSLEDTSKSDEV